MTDRKTLPKIGDRVQFGDQLYVVVQVDEETETASIIPESEIVTKPLREIIRRDDPGQAG